MNDPGSRPYGRLEQQLGHDFSNQTFCETALTHKSWLNESPHSGRTDNERLEFLGDAVLNLAVSDMLMRRFPDRAEGDLSKTRAVIVNEAGLCNAAERLDLGQWIFLGRGEEQAGGRRRPSILADAFEALMGAVYLDGGFSAAMGVVRRLLTGAIEDSEQGLRLDFKSRLQERAQALLQLAPQYTVVGQEGPDHDKTFWVAIALGAEEYGRASGKSKKEAEQSAASLALARLQQVSAASAPGEAARGQASKPGARSDGT
ncbi:MAG: ribonuclease III [Myxococcales bacterium]